MDYSNNMINRLEKMKGIITLEDYNFLIQNIMNNNRLIEEQSLKIVREKRDKEEAIKMIEDNIEKQKNNVEILKENKALKDKIKSLKKLIYEQEEEIDNFEKTKKEKVIEEVKHNDILDFSNIKFESLTKQDIKEQLIKRNIQVISFTKYSKKEVVDKLKSLNNTDDFLIRLQLEYNQDKEKKEEAIKAEKQLTKKYLKQIQSIRYEDTTNKEGYDKFIKFKNRFYKDFDKFEEKADEAEYFFQENEKEGARTMQGYMILHKENFEEGKKKYNY